MQVPLLGGVVTKGAEYQRHFPINLEPSFLDSGVSKGQFRSPKGVVAIGSGRGVDRGATEWNGRCYRVSGEDLIEVASDGVVRSIGNVGSGGPARLDYGFDRLAINSGDRLYYYDGQTLSQVSDGDLGVVHDMIWIDGFFMTTDGNSVVVTELADPFQVLPLKYGSAEEDPDMVTGLMRSRGEAYILGRHSIQVFRNVGGNGFPFQALRGATIPFGCVSYRAKAYFAESFAFVGGARNEGLGVYIAGSGTALKISPPEIDALLDAADDREAIELETRAYEDEQRLLVHLADQTLCYFASASAIAKEPIWVSLRSKGGRYRPRHAVSAYGKTIVGDATGPAIGLLSGDDARHFGEDTPWEFVTRAIYNGGKGAILNELEMVGITGAGLSGQDPMAFLSLSRDGQAWGTEKVRKLGKPGDRAARVKWWPGAYFPRSMHIRLRGHSDALAGISALEVEAEPLSA